MTSRLAAAAVVVASLAVVPAAAQKKAPAPKPAAYDLTISADGGVYTGTMTLATAAGKVTGDMHITAPAEITGKVEGTAKGQATKLDIAYKMIQRGCEGRLVMDLTTPKKGAPTTGKGEITGCGRTDANKLPATVEMKPKK